MAKKKTHEQFVLEVFGINPDIEVVDNYVNAKTSIKVRSKLCGHEWNIIPDNFFIRGNGSYCKICKPNIPYNIKTHEQFTLEVLSVNSELTLLDKYKSSKVNLLIKGKCNHEWTIQPDNFLRKHTGSKCPICNPIITSKGERQLADWLSNYVRIESNSRILYGKEIDIYIPEFKLGIEYNGEYWHSKKDKDYHLTKTIKAKELGITLIHVFEHEWLQKQEIVKSRLLSMLSNSYKLGARNCTIKEVPFPKEFLNENHIQGAGNNSKYNIALFYKELLVAVMTFSKPRFNNNYEYELIRYCSLTGINVVGGASKLLKYFIKTYNPKSIISYSDKRWSTGNLYKQLGFKYLQTSSPNYFYYKGNEVITRYKAQKHRLDKLVPDHYDKSLTETEIMTNAGYLKVYDCGNDVWVMNLAQ